MCVHDLKAIELNP